mgnify:CR=1 FL=1
MKNEATLFAVQFVFSQAGSQFAAAICVNGLPLRAWRVSSSLLPVAHTLASSRTNIVWETPHATARTVFPTAVTSTEVRGLRQQPQLPRPPWRAATAYARTHERVGGDGGGARHLHCEWHHSRVGECGLRDLLRRRRHPHRARVPDRGALQLRRRRLGSGPGGGGRRTVGRGGSGAPAG